MGPCGFSFARRRGRACARMLFVLLIDRAPVGRVSAVWEGRTDP